MGLQITQTGQHLNANRPSRYHSGFEPVDHNGNAGKSDIDKLSRDCKKNILVTGGKAKSRFTIGFEVEKSTLSHEASGNYTLFSHLERDGSCGVEAVTNILPLVGKSLWRTKVFNSILEAAPVLNDGQYAQTTSSCGGHITIRVEGYNSNDLLRLVRKNVGVLYALYRLRLNNNYCSYNPQLRVEDYSGNESEWAAARGYHRKYRVALAKSNGCLEFRLPSAVTSVKSLQLRYDLFYQIVDQSINRPDAKPAALLRKVKPILLKMYDGNADKVKELLRLASSFNQFIEDGVITPKVQPFIDPSGAAKQRWSQSAKRAYSKAQRNGWTLRQQRGVDAIGASTSTVQSATLAAYLTDWLEVNTRAGNASLSEAIVTAAKDYCVTQGIVVDSDRDIANAIRVVIATILVRDGAFSTLSEAWNYAQSRFDAEVAEWTAKWWRL